MLLIKKKKKKKSKKKRICSIGCTFVSLCYEETSTLSLVDEIGLYDLNRFNSLMVSTS